jgi:hypothetical protein
MNTCIVTIIDPADKSALKRFISLERKLLKKYPLFVSDIDDDVANTLTQKTIMSKKN